MEKRSGDLECEEDLLREMTSLRKSRGRRGEPRNLLRKGKMKAVGLGFSLFQFKNLLKIWNQ